MVTHRSKSRFAIKDCSGILKCSASVQGQRHCCRVRVDIKEFDESQSFECNGESERTVCLGIEEKLKVENPVIDLTVVLSVRDISRVHELRGLLATQAKLSKEEPGCLRFEAFESQTVPGTFILIERWASQAALDTHRTALGFTTIYAPQVLPLVDRVAHVCKALPGT